MSCEELKDLAPEVALGTIEGEERAEALRHLATCGECRRLVDQLTTVADELLMLAPVQEPPAGFESRVIDALGFQRAPRRRRGRRLLAWLGPPVAAAAVTAVALVGVYHDDHVTAERYRTTLEQADGQSFQAAPLRDGTGAEAGVAFGVPGRSVVDARHRRPRPSRRGGERRAGHARPADDPAAGLRARADGSWGGAIPVDLYDVAAIRLLGDSPGEVLQASTP